ncbi:MAG: NAD(P)-dependent alcohol dehydrogenase [Planctomycetota bacterium]
MKAVVYTRYGPPEVLRVEDVTRPVPGEKEVLVRVHATAVSSGECTMRSQRGIPAVFYLPARLMFGVFRPRNTRPGSEFAGVVESVGSAVETFKPGERVFGSTSMKAKAHAEYLCLAEDDAVTTTPIGLSHAEAAAIPFGAFAALGFLRLGGIEERRGQNVMVIGAAGAVGSAAVQLARHFGARVTGVCSTSKVELVKTLGAERVIDYTKEDIAAADSRYDIVFDTVGKTRYAQVKPVMAERGRYVNAGFGLRKLLQMAWTSWFSQRKVICSVTGESAEDLKLLKALVEDGLIRAVIDRRFTLDQIVEAHRYVDAGHKSGSVVVTMPVEA